MNDDQIEKRDAMQDAFLKAIELPEGYHHAYGGEHLNEFSTHYCECCKTYLAGDRYKAFVCHDNDKGKFESEEIAVCTDCINFIANGDLPETWRK